MDPYPLYAFYTGKPLDKGREHLLSIDVHTVESGILGNEYKFPYTAVCQRLGLFLKSCHRNRCELSLDLGNCTVGTSAVATVGNLEVSIMPRGRQVAASPASLGGKPHPFHNLLPLERPEESIHFRKTFLKILRITFAQTAAYDNLPHLPLFLGLDGGKYLVYGFFLGISYESACVDDYHIRPGLGIRNILGDDLDSAIAEFGQKLL